MAKMLEKYYKEKTLIYKNIKDIENLIHSLELNDTYRQKLLKRQKELAVDVENLKNNEYPIAVLANWNAGKSTFINALMGREILPMRNKSYTSEITRIRYSDEPKIIIKYANEKQQVVPLTHELTEDFLVKYVTVDGIASKDRKVQEVIVEYPLEICKEGIVLVDTPGVNSINNLHDDITYQVVPNAKAIIMLVTADSPGGKEEVDFLKRILIGRDKNEYDIIFVINKVDSITKEDLEDAIESVKMAISKVTDEVDKPLIEDPTIIPVSSYAELKYQLYKNNVIGFEELSSDVKLYYKNSRGRRNKIEKPDDIEHLQSTSNFQELRGNLNDAFMNLDTTKRLLASIRTGMYSLCFVDILRYLQKSIYSLENARPLEELEREAEKVEQALRNAENEKIELVNKFEREMNELVDDYVNHLQDDWRNKVTYEVDNYIDSLSMNQLKNNGSNLISNEFKKLIQREYYHTSKKMSTRVEKMINSYVVQYNHLIKQTDMHLENLDQISMQTNDAFIVKSIDTNMSFGLSDTNRIMVAGGLVFAGAQVGALLGSVVPILGNIIGGLLGGLIGGLLGFFGVGPSESKVKRDIKARVAPELNEQANNAYQKQRTSIIESIENTKTSGIEMFNTQFGNYSSMIEYSYQEIKSNMQLKEEQHQTKIQTLDQNIVETIQIIDSLQPEDAIQLV